jgi:hypothetical protein
MLATLEVDPSAAASEDSLVALPRIEVRTRSDHRGCERIERQTLMEEHAGILSRYFEQSRRLSLRRIVSMIIGIGKQLASAGGCRERCVFLGVCARDRVLQ